MESRNRNLSCVEWSRKPPLSCGANLINYIEQISKVKTMLIGRIFLVLAWKLILGSAYKDISISGEVKRVTLRIYGDLATASEFIICIPGMNPDLVYEWGTVAEPLSKEGNAVGILNLHGAQKYLKSDQLVTLISNDVLRHPEINKKTFILMGKSWGGAKSIEFTLQKFDIVKKLALIAPAGGTVLIPEILSKPGTLPTCL